MDAKDIVDTTGLLCPLPVLKARKRLQALQPGEVLHLIADDPAAQIDVPHFCNEQNHSLIRVEKQEHGWLFAIAKGPK